MLGNGDDAFIWDPGDGSDVVEGQKGFDTMVFNGAAAAEHFDVIANGHRLTFFGDVGTITMDTDGVERVDANALGGADVVTVSDVSGTDVTEVNVDLAAALGGTAGDGLGDRVIVVGSTGDDTIEVSGDAAGVNVTSLAATVGVRHAEAANHRLEIETKGGADSITSAGLAAGVIQLFVDGALVLQSNPAGIRGALVLGPRIHVQPPEQAPAYGCLNHDRIGLFSPTQAIIVLRDSGQFTNGMHRTHALRMAEAERCVVYRGRRELP